ncbi:MAG: hypothetical protein ACYC9S_04425 [Leptospirales bacterium]
MGSPVRFRRLRFFLSEQWRLLKDIFARVGDMIRPRIELLQSGLKRRSLESRRNRLMESLGEESHKHFSSSSKDWLVQMKESERIQTLVKRIGVLDRLDKKLQTEESLLEETQLMWILTNLSAELSSQRLEAKAHWIREGSPLMGFTLTEIRQHFQKPGFVVLMAIKRGYTVELSQDTPLGDSDMVVYLSPANTLPFSMGEPLWQLHSNG